MYYFLTAQDKIWLKYDIHQLNSASQDNNNYSEIFV